MTSRSLRVVVPLTSKSLVTVSAAAVVSDGSIACVKTVRLLTFSESKVTVPLPYVNVPVTVRSVIVDAPVTFRVPPTEKLFVTVSAPAVVSSGSVAFV